MVSITASPASAASDTNAVPLVASPTCVKAPRIPRQTHVPIAAAQVAMALLAWIALLGIAALVYVAWLEIHALWRLFSWMVWVPRG